tara:strand:- start:251 stop:550 length:300 start_codon:yes stop_codon:yes gene_type:complete
MFQQLYINVIKYKILKKILGIIVLGLLFSSNAHASKLDFLYNSWVSIKYFIYADRSQDDSLLTILTSLIWEWRAAIIGFVVVFIIIKIFEIIKRKSKNK